ncbi:MAG: hypothetical protein WD767_11295 [Alphaproteobacteria bacterium]
MTASNNPPRSRRNTKLRTGLTIVSIIVVGAGIGWAAAKYLTSPGLEPESAALVLPRREAVVPAVPADMAAKEDAGASKQPEQAPAVMLVGSYGQEQSYPIDEWTLGTAPSGFIDSASVNGRALGPEAGMPPLRGRDVLELSGWAGDVSIGLRYPYVLISACGRILAHAAVNLQRPDVANAVHENLRLSGWRVTIAAAHLPQCKGGALRAWGVAPGDRKLLLPLNRHVALSDTAIELDRDARFAAAEPPLHAADMPPIAPVILNVRAKVLNMRRCAKAECAVTGQLAQGTWNVLELGGTVDWMLVALPGRAGWISRQDAEITQNQR